MDEADNGFNNSQTKMTMTTKTKTPLSAIAEAFEELSRFLECQMKDEEELRLDTFCDACSLVSVLFSTLGLAFKFAEMEYVAKVRDLVEASKRFATLENVLDLDVANGTVKKAGSHSRNLRRVRQGLDLIRALFEEFLSSEYVSFALPYCILVFFFPFFMHYNSKGSKGFLCFLKDLAVACFSDSIILHGRCYIQFTLFMSSHASNFTPFFSFKL
ncbi:hypothetical protein REPUB_Repub04eG0259300 [Reevesia pubescens]